jgi:hypothetical protein
MMRTDVEDKQDQLKFVKFNDLEENFPVQSFLNENNRKKRRIDT